jgi:hypothetical protein
MTSNCPKKLSKYGSNIHIFESPSGELIYGIPHKKISYPQLLELWHYDWYNHKCLFLGTNLIDDRITTQMGLKYLERRSSQDDCQMPQSIGSA